MRLPRNLSGDELIKRLQRFGYAPTRQTGSHIRPTRTAVNVEHHITVPRHNPLRVGALNNILTDVAQHLNISKDELLRELL
jgi:predicted RNA binding protein YcfA (HicA-like mRNA interferase family)